MLEQDRLHRLLSERQRSWFQSRDIETLLPAERLEAAPSFWSRAFWSLSAWRQLKRSNDEVRLIHNAVKRMIPREATRPVSEIEADIARLPQVCARDTTVALGHLAPLGPNKRLFAELELPQPMEEREIQLGYGRRACASFEEFRTRAGISSWIGVEGVSDLLRQQASSVQTTEHSVENSMCPGTQDWTQTSVSLTISKNVTEAIRARCLAFFELSTDAPERLALLTIDVPAEVHLGSQKLSTGGGESFRSISSGPFQPIRYALHLFLPPPWIKPETAQGDAWPPSDYALDYPFQTIEIEEYLAENGS